MDTLDSKFFTKKELFSWANQLIQANYPTSSLSFKSIEDFANGVGYCFLLNIAHPGKVKIQKLNQRAKLQHENLANLKILSTAMLDAGIDKAFQASRIATKKTNDLLELLQWFRKYFFNQGSSNFLSLDKQNISAAEYRRSSLSIKPSTANEKKRISINNIRAPQIINQSNSSISRKRLPSEEQMSDEYKNCFKINKEIQTIVSDQQSSADVKLQNIKKILFPNSINDNNKQTSQRDQGQKNQKYDCTFSQMEKSESIPAIAEGNKIDQEISEIKIEQNLYEGMNSISLQKSDTRKALYSPDTSLISNRTSLLPKSLVENASTQKLYKKFEE